MICDVQYLASHIFSSALSHDEHINRSGGATFKADDDRIYSEGGWLSGSE